MKRDREEIRLSDDTPKVQPQAAGQPAQPAVVLDNETVLDRSLSTPVEEVIPWEEVQLPSKGLYYNWTSGIIQVRAWNIKVDQIFATSRLAQSGQSVDYVIRNCCRFPGGFDPQELLVGDQIFLLYYLRGITYGDLYEFASACPACGATNMHSVAWSELAKTVQWANEILGSEPFRIDLPYLSERMGTNVWVSLRFMRVKDSQVIARKQKAQNRVGKGSAARVRQRNLQKLAGTQQTGETDVQIDDTLTENLEQLVVDVMGVSDIFKIQGFMERLHSRDSAAIRDWLTQHTPGIDTVVEMTCADCNNEYKAMLPITESFFRSQDSRTV